mgnify:CR=1 FL=1
MAFSLALVDFDGTLADSMPYWLRLPADTLRAAGLPLLPTDNPHVVADLAKVRDGQALSPVLLVRGDLAGGVPAQVADGYHRICASWYLDENTQIPCRIVALPS